MPFERRYCPEQRFMLTTLGGRIDDDDLMDHVLALNEQTAGIEGLLEFGDCAGVKDIDSLSVRGTTRCAEREAVKPGSRLVIYVPPNDPLTFGLARAYQAFAEDKRDAVRGCSSVDEALTWLTQGNEEKMTAIRRFMEEARDALP